MVEGKARQREDFLLLSTGFEPMGDDLWRRDGICFGREAALQTGQLELLERDGCTVYDLYEQAMRVDESQAS